MPGRDNLPGISQALGNKAVQVMMYSNDQPPRGRHDEETFMALCSSQYTHVFLSVMSELLTEAVQSVTFNAWINFAGDRIFRRRKGIYAAQTFGSVHLAPLTWQPPKFPVASARETSDGEEGAAGLSSAGTGFPSPYGTRDACQ